MNVNTRFVVFVFMFIFLYFCSFSNYSLHASKGLQAGG